MPPKRFRQTRKVICEKDDDVPWVIEHCRIDSKYVDSNDTPVAGVPPGGAQAPPKSSFFSSLFGRSPQTPAPASTAAAAPPSQSSSESSQGTANGSFTVRNPLAPSPPTLISGLQRTLSNPPSSGTPPSLGASSSPSGVPPNLSGASSSSGTPPSLGASSSPSGVPPNLSGASSSSGPPNPSVGASSSQSRAPPPSSLTPQLGAISSISSRVGQPTKSGVPPGGVRTQNAKSQSAKSALRAAGQGRVPVVRSNVVPFLLHKGRKPHSRIGDILRNGGGKIIRQHIGLKKSHKNSNKQRHHKKKNRRTKRRNH